MQRGVQHLVIKTLDNPPRVLFWRVDEFLLLALPPFLGLLLGSFLVMIAGFALKPLYTRLHRRFPKGTLRHRLYWILPKSAFRRAGLFQTLPPSYYRELLL